MSFNNPQVWIVIAFCLCFMVFLYKGVGKIKQTLDQYIGNIENQFQRAKDLCHEAQERVSCLQNEQKKQSEEGDYAMKQTSLEIEKLDFKLSQRIQELEMKYASLFLHESEHLKKEIKEKLLRELGTEVYHQVNDWAGKMSMPQKKAFMARQISQMRISNNSLLCVPENKE